MKKIILVVILLAAAGGALYYYYQENRDSEPVSVASYKEAIIGDWKIDSISSKDSNRIGLILLLAGAEITNYTFRFTEDGSVTQLLNDSIVPEKARYEWKDSSQFVFIEGDSIADQENMRVLTLTPEQLHLMSADSAVIYFKKKN